MFKFNSSRIGLYALLPLVALAISACGHLGFGLDEAPRGKLPVMPIDRDLPDYNIQVGDVLEIKMLLNPELEEELLVRPDGKVSTSVVQDVVAYGRTPSELQKELNSLYKEQLSNPDVAVIVKTFAPTRVYVLGEVESPGEYVSVGPNMTLLQALSRAGGVQNSAKIDEVVIIRRGATDEPQAYAANFKTASNGSDPGADVRLMAYDVVFVPRTAIAEAYLTYVQQFVRPSVGLGFSYSLNNDDNN
jgi:polysaccharide export outer membrane protein